MTKIKLNKKFKILQIIPLLTYLHINSYHILGLPAQFKTKIRILHNKVIFHSCKKLSKKFKRKFSGSLKFLDSQKKLLKKKFLFLLLIFIKSLFLLFSIMVKKLFGKKKFL